MFAAILLTIAIGWLVLQLLSLRLMRGRWRVAAFVPAATMTLALAVGIIGGLAGANMAPMWIVLALPACLAWLVTLWIVRGVALLLGRATSRP